MTASDIGVIGAGVTTLSATCSPTGFELTLLFDAPVSSNWRQSGKLILAGVSLNDKARASCSSSSSLSSCSEGALALLTVLVPPVDSLDGDAPLVLELLLLLVEELARFEGVLGSCLTARASTLESLDNFSWHPSQTRTFFSMFNLGKGIC